MTAAPPAAGFGAAARLLAWTVTAGALAAVIYSYDSLPAEIPLTRWTSAPKSPLVALRVPLINLLTIALIEVLRPALQRLPDFDRAGAVVSVLMLTAAAKTAIEAAGILRLPTPQAWTFWPLVVVLALGLTAAAFLSRSLLHPRRWSELTMTRAEIAAAVALVAGIVALNAPLVVR